MRILIGSSSFPGEGRGISTYVHDLMCLLTTKGHEVYLTCPGPTNKLEFKKFFLSDQFSEPLITSRRMLDYIRANRIDLVINNDNPLLQSLFPLLDIRCFSIAHMNHTSVASLAVLNYKWADKIIAISSDMKSEYLRRFGIPEDKIVMLPNSIPNKNFSFSDKNNDELVVVYTGGSNKNKGFNHVLSLLKEANQWGLKKVSFELYGEFSQSDMKKIRSFSNIKVSNFGSVPRTNLLSSFKKSHILLFPSYNEGCPITILEAMSFGMLTITTNGIGGMKDLISHGINGFTYDFPEWHMNAIQQLVILSKDYQLLEKMMIDSVTMQRNNFSQDTYYQKLLSPMSCEVSKPKKSATIYKWHRSVNVRTGNANIIDKCYLKLGWLRKHGTLTL